ncbi:MAG TPA: hypothetical protein H9932_10085, partial [Candidatus Brachybacterium intestinipullorum]|nr:hypothetical protein [Candidatus Brachybacterium intestinipullorum]
RTRPERSLAVLTFTEEHARRLMERIMNTVSVIPALRDYFDPGAREVFTVLPAAQATSVLRDDIIVSVGFGKTPHGRLLHRFGPLSEESGRKALATVITRARGRTTVVSSLGVQDLDHARMRTDGARDLRALLWVLQGGHDVPVVPHVAALTGSEEAVAPPLPEAPRAAPAAPEQEELAAAAEQSAAGTGQESGTADAAGEDLSDEDLDAAIEAALARKASASADSADAAPETEQGAEAEQETGPEAGPADETDAGDGAGPDGETVPVGDTAPDGDTAADGDTAPDGADGPSEETAPEGGTAPLDAAPAPRELETDALLQDLADRLRRLGLLVERDFGLSGDRIELALGHPDMPGRLLLAVDTDGSHYVDTPSQRERDRLRAERLEAAGWATERVWSWALFIDPDGEAERIRRALDRALRLVQAEESSDSPSGVGTVRHRLPRPQIPAGHPLSFYSSDDFDAVVEYICSDGRARLEEHLATEVRSFLGFEQRSVLLDVSVSSAIRRYQERQ